ncbi:TPA: hypothetical protein DCZ46_02810 [Candidatus Campbellbacteria bacterium]|nr:MAG: seg [Candidatus Campbellbacteria bacterium GW2011_OD1_34_28]KKP74943.1 MAG: hypothetical protein UR74_C0002G0209 [Candidatus Campbellbacteria bacterium GW2011_GWD2_35_24]KKP75829.1 MAG: hypothetical protein UR75_C0002G0210 [Candidatus Campbellbacteria bacterium GW2011_GWC2_35_28]KKP76923.1 MAG: hypothetical protein UR76_C0002G0124 [Candidatus Campbellbacteria bacterium GW2011_GWC1_35_31]KKP78849.1 MAG: hypothetical protein UR79_C0002G0124 [Candidatus Campbellbacteria bacterium GW2011_GW
MAQRLVALTELGQILNPLYDSVTPRMMASDDGELGFTEEDFPGRRADMYIVCHPDNSPSGCSGDFFSADIQHDIFPDGFEDDGELIFANDEHIFPDEQAMCDPAYAEAWTQFVAEKGVSFTNRWMRTEDNETTAKSPTSQRQQEKILIPPDSERSCRSHGRRGRRHVPTIPERIRHHNKTLSVLAPAE